jgi:hypothetical protein
VWYGAKDNVLGNTSELQCQNTNRRTECNGAKDSNELNVVSAIVGSAKAKVSGGIGWAKTLPTVVCHAESYQLGSEKGGWEVNEKWRGRLRQRAKR